MDIGLGNIQAIGHNGIQNGVIPPAAIVIPVALQNVDLFLQAAGANPFGILILVVTRIPVYPQGNGIFEGLVLIVVGFQEIP